MLQFFHPDGFREVRRHPCLTAVLDIVGEEAGLGLVGIHCGLPRTAHADVLPECVGEQATDGGELGNSLLGDDFLRESFDFGWRR